MNVKIKKIIKKAFEDNGIDSSNFSQDVICFNEDATRCAVIYDDAKLEKTFIIVCIQGNETFSFGIQYELAMFEVRDNGQYDGIDAMHLADNFLTGNYSLATTQPELKRKLENKK